MQMKLSRKAALLSACALLAAVCLGAARFAGVGAGFVFSGLRELKRA